MAISLTSTVNALDLISIYVILYNRGVEKSIKIETLYVYIIQVYISLLYLDGMLNNANYLVFVHVINKPRPAG